MCGRFVAMTDPEGLTRFFVVDDRRAKDLPPNPNVAPTEEVYAVAQHDGRRTLVTFRWGLVPRWAPDPRTGARMINARAETVASKPAFREAFARRRCLIPADGFYEWERRSDGSKVPHHIAAADGSPLALAGIWESWRADGERLLTCAVITTTANATVAALHDRMPVVLPASRWDRWLDPSADEADLQRLLAPAGDAALVSRPVSVALNDPRMKDPAVALRGASAT